MNKFRPSNNAHGLLLTCGATSRSGLVPGDGTAVMFANPGEETIYVVYSDSLPLTAANTGYPIFRRTKESLDFAGPVLYVAALAASGSGLLLSVHRGYEVEE